MKTPAFFSRLRLAFTFIVLAANGWPTSAQPVAPHHFAGLTPQADSSVLLQLGGNAPVSARNYLDLFPIETSNDLLEWQPLTVVLRTNRLTEPPRYWHVASTAGTARFYRTPTNHLVTPLPLPDGPRRVGVFSRLLTDAARTNRYVKTNNSFVVKVWHPAQAAAGVLPASYVDPKIAALGGAFCVSANTRAMRTHALPGAPVVATEASWPVLLYSHGHQTLATENTRRLENLASHGFVVIGMDHVDCFATVFPDGRLFRGVQLPNLGVGDAATKVVVMDRLADIRFVLDELERWNAGDPLLQGRLDLERVGILGFSFGGATAAAACAMEPRLKAGLSLDGGGPDIPLPVPNGPFLILGGGDSDTFMQPLRNAFRSLFDTLARNAWWIQLKDSSHCHFNDTPWFDSPTSPVQLRRALLIDLCAVSFFRRFLRDEDDHFLDAQPLGWPEVEALLRK